MTAKNKIPGATAALLVAIILCFATTGRAAGLAELRDWLADRQVALHGFVEIRAGWRLQADRYEKAASLAEERLQLDLDYDLDWGILKLKGDLWADQVVEEAQAELREFNLAFTPLEIMDVKVGRQVLTWGTGDLLFINDLFPKDWHSFFIGRDNEYLKAPSDAVRVSWFLETVNIDLVWTPEFSGSEYPDGSRLSYWNGSRVAGREAILAVHRPDRFGRDSEYAVRLYKNVQGLELGLYGYHGFWQTPEGVHPLTGKGVFPNLSVYGASLRGALFGGVANAEAGYYDSRQDRGGDDPLLRNSEWRLLLGFERELGRDLTGGLQYYLELRQDYEAYLHALPPGQKSADEYRHVLTVRLTKMLLNQNLRLSLFGYYSPSDQDGYLRPNGHYKINDRWAVEGGGNLFFGAADHTFFGQFKDNSNVYAGLRCSF